MATKPLGILKIQTLVYRSFLFRTILLGNVVWVEGICFCFALSPVAVHAVVLLIMYCYEDGLTEIIQN